MYPLKIIAVGCGELEVFALRRELAKLPGILEKEFPDSDAAVAAQSALTGSKYLFIVRVDSAQSLRQLKRLNRAYPGQPWLNSPCGWAGLRLTLH